MNIWPGVSHTNKVGSIVGIKTCSVSYVFPWCLQFVPLRDPVTSYQGKIHTKLISIGNISGCTAESKPEIYTNAFGFSAEISYIHLITAEWKECIVFLLQNDEHMQAPRWEGLQAGAYLAVVWWARDTLRAIPYARLALACAIVSHTIALHLLLHYTKENQYSNLWHGQQTVMGTALQRPVLTDTATLLLCEIHSRLIFAPTTTTFMS